MLPLSFLYAAALLVIGGHGLQSAGEPAAIRALVMPAFFFGGAALICALFALREPRHGLAGASFLAFIAVLTNASTLIGPLARSNYEWSNPMHRLATLVLGASLLYVLCAIAWWKRTRRAAAIAELRGE